MTPRLGIIGGGQLALYLCKAAQALGADVAIIADPGDAPALELANKAFLASPRSMVAVDQFLANCDVVTFDKEGIPDPLLDYVMSAQGQGHFAVRPGIETVRLLKDKALQKDWLVKQGLPTLPYAVLSERGAPLDFLERKFGSGLVQKTRSGGYDGRGVQILAPLQAAQQLWKIPSIVEPYLPDCREIAVVIARAPCGEVQVFPPVSMEFDAQLNAVKTVTIPALISHSLTVKAENLARRAIAALGGIGVFAIEMFLTPAGKLLINEISPRVHNSGHVTLDACNVSQFEQHVRAVLDLPLVPVRLAAAAAMLNILYAAEDSVNYPPTPITESLPDCHARVYWYGKTAGQPGRKMGHINAVGSCVEEAVARAQKALASLGGNNMGEAA